MFDSYEDRHEISKDIVSEETLRGVSKEEIENRLTTLIKNEHVIAWVEGKGNDWAIYYELPVYHFPIDSNGEEFDDDGHAERFDARCQAITDKVFDAAEISKDDFVVRFAYVDDDDPDVNVFRIVPKKLVSKRDIRYYVQKSVELYEKAEKIISKAKDKKSKAVDHLIQTQAYGPLRDLETEYNLNLQRHGTYGDSTFQEDIGKAGGYNVWDMELMLRERGVIDAD